MHLGLGLVWARAGPGLGSRVPVLVPLDFDCALQGRAVSCSGDGGGGPDPQVVQRGAPGGSREGARHRKVEIKREARKPAVSTNQGLAGRLVETRWKDGTR